jgi:hypothetical protein
MHPRTHTSTKVEGTRAWLGRKRERSRGEGVDRECRGDNGLDGAAGATTAKENRGGEREMDRDGRG